MPCLPEKSSPWKVDRNCLKCKPFNQKFHVALFSGMMFHLRLGLYFLNAMKSSLGLRGFITIFSWKATALHRQAKLFDLNLFRRKTFHKMVKPDAQN